MQFTLKSSPRRLCDMTSLQHMSSLLFIGMTGPNVTQCIYPVSIVLHEAKTVVVGYYFDFS